MQDELMLLWQQGASSEPNPEEVARLAAKATVTRFDKMIATRNLREYSAFALVLAFFIWRAVWAGEWLQAGVSLACAGFSVAYLWWQHRKVSEPDAAADARTYQAAMLVRIDHQIRLLRTARYWYILPLYVPPLWILFEVWKSSHLGAIFGWATVTSAYVWVLRLNEKVGVGFLQAERARIEALYTPK